MLLSGYSLIPTELKLKHRATWTVVVSSVSPCHSTYTYKPHTHNTDRHTRMYTQGWQMSLHRPKQVGRQEVKDFKKGSLISPEKAWVVLISTEKYLSHLGDWVVAGEKSMKDGEHTPGKYSRWDSTFQASGASAGLLIFFLKYHLESLSSFWVRMFLSRS